MLPAVFIIGSIFLWVVLGAIADTAGSYDFVTPMICVAVFAIWLALWLGFVIGRA